MLGRPIKPDEVVASKVNYIPPAVFEAFNQLIIQNFNHGSATVRQDEVVDLILKADELDISRADIFDRHYLDVEELYEEAGWRVTYDKPAYNETYPATFRFEFDRPRFS